MNQRELNELRRRFRPDRSGISRIYGCYVNGGGEIITEINASLGAMPEEEAEQYLGLLKKCLSGGLGRGLIDIAFTTQQVMDSEEHRLLSALRDSALQDGAVRARFYRKVIDALGIEDSSYLILLAHDRYDVPCRGKDDSLQPEASEQVYSYILCSICRVKPVKPQLSYCAPEKAFHNRSIGQIVAPPDLGFLFPAFDGRAANLYNALFYSRSAQDIHQEFIDAVFHTQAPMAPQAQKESFRMVLSESLGEACSFEVVQSIHGQLCERLEEHKESKNPEPLDLSQGEMSRVLENCGVPEQQVNTFLELCTQEFGEGAALTPGNLIDSRKLQIRTPEVVVTVHPESGYLLETRLIQGRKYLLIPADHGVEVNGVSVEI